MKLIPYSSEHELNKSNQIKLIKFNSDVDNVNAERFAETIVIDGVYYLPYIEKYDSYYTDAQKERIVEINLEEYDN